MATRKITKEYSATTGECTRMLVETYYLGIVVKEEETIFEDEEFDGDDLGEAQ